MDERRHEGPSAGQAGELCLAAVAVVAACSSPSQPGVVDVHTAGDVARVAAPVRLNQIFGDVDRAFVPPVPTLTQSATRVGLWGDDDGASFEHKGRVYFLFGDGVPTTAGDPARPRDADVVAWADASATPEDGFDVHFFTDDTGLYVPVTLDGKFMLALQGPDGGFSDGTHVYAFFCLGLAPTYHSVLGVSDDDGLTFRTVIDTPSSALVHVYPQIVTTSDIDGLSAQWSSPTTVLLFGRRSTKPPLLAAAPLDQVTDATAWRWLTRDAATGAATWGSNAAAASPVFDFDAGESSSGGFSIFWLPGVNRWIAFYPVKQENNEIAFRSAPSALGPWSEPAMLFDPDRDQDHGYCNFVHWGCGPTVFGPSEPVECCDVDYDPMRYGGWGPGQTGFVYAPQPILPWTRSDPASGTSTLYFLMSAGNPYSAMTMRVTLSRTD